MTHSNSTATDSIDIFTDGACKGNPGPGGWGVLLRWKAHEKELFGGEANTTNNRMELRAIIEAIRAIKGQRKLRIHTDSSYVEQGMTAWIFNWRRDDWQKAREKKIKNLDLWQELDRLAQQQQIEWVWVRGHNGHFDNERADALANRACLEFLPLEQQDKLKKQLRKYWADL